MKFPVNCKKCNQLLYGPVKYCPFCGVTVASETAETLSLIINTNPAGASVFLNGDRKGTSPLTINDLEKGNYTVRLELTGYKPKEEHVSIGQEGQKLDINLEKEKPRPKYWVAAVIMAVVIILVWTLLPKISGHPKRLASLTISTQPSGAKVFLNGDRKGNSPQTINDIKEGSYTVRVELEGYEAKEEQIALNRENRTFDITLRKKTEAPIPLASLTINTRPAGAAVFLNGDRKGNSPLTINDLKKGSYIVRLELDGYKPKEEKVLLDQDSHRIVVELAAKPAPDKNDRTGPSSITDTLKAMNKEFKAIRSLAKAKTDGDAITVQGILGSFDEQRRVQSIAARLTNGNYIDKTSVINEGTYESR